MIIQVVFWVLSVAFVTIFVGRAWSLGPLRAKSRDQVVRSAIDAVVVLAAVRALFPPPDWASWLWVVATVAVGIGIAGVIIGWRSWPSTKRWWATAIYVVIGAALVVVLA